MPAYRHTYIHTYIHLAIRIDQGYVHASFVHSTMSTLPAPCVRRVLSSMHVRSRQHDSINAFVHRQHCTCNSHSSCCFAFIMSVWVPKCASDSFGHACCMVHPLARDENDLLFPALVLGCNASARKILFAAATEMRCARKILFLSVVLSSQPYSTGMHRTTTNYAENSLPVGGLVVPALQY